MDIQSRLRPSNPHFQEFLLTEQQRPRAMATGNAPAYHCIVCTLTKIPFASLSKDSQHKIVKNGRPTPLMPNLTARCLNSLNLSIHDWMTGCDRDRKLFCWPCLLFNTSPYDVWGKRGFADFYRLSSATIEHTKDVSHQAKSKTLKLWIETSSELSESSEEDLECIPELDFLNENASEPEEELDVKPNLEALNASIGLLQQDGKTGVDLCETVARMASGGAAGTYTAVGDEPLAPEERDCEAIVPSPPPAIVIDSPEPEACENSCTSNATTTVPQGDEPARIYKESNGLSDMSQPVQQSTEKYQLKWNSHQQNLNSSLSSLYKNDRYADVMLLSCNGDEEPFTIPAHKLILGTSSLYFANIFEKAPVPSNTLTYIVLPPQLSCRTMQTLIQYMYTGESTVSVDIINEVLHGGEILKIRGLYRNHGTSDGAGGLDASSGGPKDPERTVTRTDKTLSERYESPVVVTAPVPHGCPAACSSAGQFFHVKKDVAIDPSEKRRQSPVIQDGQRQRINSVTNQENVHRTAGTERRREPVSKQIGSSRVVLSDAENVTAAANIPASGVPVHDAVNFLHVKEEPVEWTEVRADELNLPRGDIPVVKQEQEPISKAPPDQPIYSPLTCELCSETFTVPSEWVRHIESHSDASQAVPKRRRRADNEGHTDATAALRCDLCTMLFITPAEWVRHVQSTHTETELAMSNNSAYPRRRDLRPGHPPDGQQHLQHLQSSQEKLCTVCNKVFPSYASMVIHQRTHTGEKPFYCDFCNKGFNVKSNLLRHMRTLHNQQAGGGHTPTTDPDSAGSE